MEQLNLRIPDLARNTPPDKRRRISLRLRLFSFFLLFLVIIAIGLVLVLCATGVFSVGRTESRVFITNELTHLSQNIENEFLKLSVESISLSQKLSDQIENELFTLGCSPSALPDHPETLEPVLRICMDTLTSSMVNNTTSGAFIMLNATMNPTAPGAENSRAGIFIRNMEPNALYPGMTSFHYLRGPMKLAQERRIPILPQWKMEFTMEDCYSWRNTLATSWHDGDLSRLYFWNPRSMLSGDYDEAMLLILPLFASDGTTLGLCGFEVNAMLFKLQNAPDNSIYRDVFSLLAPMESSILDTDHALFAGNFGTHFTIEGVMAVASGHDGMDWFVGQNGSHYLGLWREVHLYPKGAIHGQQTWVVAVLMPEQNISDYAAGKNDLILILLIFLLATAVITAVCISRRSLRPVYLAFENVKTRGLSDCEKSNIREIDDLFAFLAEQDNLAKPKDPTFEDLAVTPDMLHDHALPIENEQNAHCAQDADSAQAVAAFTNRYKQFQQDLATLSRAQRRVFDLYVKNYSAPEIAMELHLSMNTIKTHNRNIYIKLGVKSIRELMVFVNIMKDGSSKD